MTQRVALFSGAGRDSVSCSSTLQQDRCSLSWRIGSPTNYFVALLPLQCSNTKQVSISYLTTALAFAPQWINVVHLMHLTALPTSYFEFVILVSVNQLYCWKHRLELKTAYLQNGLRAQIPRCSHFAVAKNCISYNLRCHLFKIFVVCSNT